MFQWILTLTRYPCVWFNPKSAGLYEIVYGAPSSRLLTQATAYEYCDSTIGDIGRTQNCIGISVSV